MPRKAQSLESRLLKRREISTTSFYNDEPCWMWTGALRSKTRLYGTIKVSGFQESVSRMAAMLWLEDYQCDLFVLHHCDNPTCFNPKHLFMGTHSDNMIDCARKGRLNSQNRIKKDSSLEENKQPGLL